MSLRGIFDGGGVRKQNGHWQSSGKQDNVIVYDGVGLVSGNPNPVIFKVKFDPLVGITFNKTLHFEMSNTTTVVRDDSGEWTEGTGFMGLANDPIYGNFGTVEVRHNYEDNGSNISALISYQNTTGELIGRYDWRYSYNPVTASPKLAVRYANEAVETTVVADVSYTMRPVQETPMFICETFKTNTAYSFDMDVSFTIPPIPVSQTEVIEYWRGEDVELIIKPYIRVYRRGDDTYLHSRTTFNVTLN